MNFVRFISVFSFVVLTACDNGMGKFEVVEPGVVRDTETGLEWQRCSIGQQWNEETKSCDGELSRVNFQDGIVLVRKFLAEEGSDWHVPEVRELHTIIDCSEGFTIQEADIGDGLSPLPSECNNWEELDDRPTLNAKAFPNQIHSGFGAVSYWTETTNTPNKGHVWGIMFSSGRLIHIIPRETPYMAIRMVRRPAEQ